MSLHLLLLLAEVEAEAHKEEGGEEHDLIEAVDAGRSVDRA